MPFIAFEGLDGAGKSTLIQRLVADLRSQGQAVVVTREPGGTPLGEEIRELLLRKGGDTPSARTELLLYEAGRAQHVDRVIRPALNRGEWVLCDRYSASSVAFQVGGRGLSAEQVYALNDFAVDGVVPDLWVLLDLTVAESRKRQGVRGVTTGAELDRFESEADQFHERVRLNYLDQAKAEPESWLVLSADVAPSELYVELVAQLKRRKWLS